MPVIPADGMVVDSANAPIAHAEVELYSVKKDSDRPAHWRPWKTARIHKRFPHPALVARAAPQASPAR